MAADRFQVLALDGGGVLGVFTAAILAGLERDLGCPVAAHFDLITGTSTGGIIALALGAGVSPEELVELYSTEMQSVFPHPRGVRRLRQMVRPKYGSGRLELVLRNLFGTTLLGDSSVPLVIPAFNLGENDVYLFKTRHHERLRRDHSLPMWQVAMATAAAPTFFPAYELPGDGTRLIDGGVWANSPAMVGVVEATSMFGQPLESVRVLSLGTTAKRGTRGRQLDKGGVWQWGRSPNIVETLLNGQSAGAFAQVQHLIGKSNAHRVNPAAPDSLARLDRADARDLLAKAGHHSRHFCPTFVEVFGDHTPSRQSNHGPRAGSELP